MALSLSKENYDLHKLHSLTGVLPVGFYMLQHLTLNSFAWAGAAKFDGVIGFFEGIPGHILLAMEVFLIWLPLLFHAVYGTFIAFRAQTNNKLFNYKENTMFVLQRVSGLFAFLFLITHVITTTGNKYLHGVETIKFAAWHDKLTSFGYIWLVFYALGVAACSYHLGYGLFNFCIRWGITISEKSQLRMQKVSLAVFVLGTALGILALAGFLKGSPAPVETTAYSNSSPTTIA